MALTTNLRALSLALAAGLLAAPAAFAETPEPATMQLAQDEEQPAQAPAGTDEAEAEAIEPDEQQLESFVNATVRIITIQHEAEQEIMANEEQEAQEQVRDEALQMIVAAVQEEGLSVDEYNGIVQQVESDPDLGETVQQRIQEQVAE